MPALGLERGAKSKWSKIKAATHVIQPMTEIRVASRVRNTDLSGVTTGEPDPLGFKPTPPRFHST